MIRTFHRRTAVILMLGLAMTSCSHQYYAPNLQQVPLFTEKHQGQITASGSVGDKVTATDIGGAYSVASHIAIMGSANWYQGTFNSDDDYMRSRYGEVAVGYFTPFDKYGVFEIYGGAGVNAQHHQYGYDTVTANLHFSKLFIQPVIGFKRKHFEAGFSFRVSYLNFSSINSVGNADYHEFPKQRDYWLIEPALTIRAGGENVKFQFQRQLSSSFDTSRPDWNYSQSMFSFGIQFVIKGEPEPAAVKTQY